MRQCDAVWSAGPVGGPQATTSAGGVSPLSLLTFFAAAKKVSAAPHRGNARKPTTSSGCQRIINPNIRQSDESPYRG
ncbi:hypothetical protein FRZ40_19605 [Paraburkholderia azotifigens]|uniref:Uncharacterized protein n=1 Tax=Paraburkholderia azotifigens TaxID=2057004 RepID=A0A5C6VDL7_9BURK|nr:hypothetical protein FRZ40_19605 [Paraburkholderia azotifigens]